MNRTKLYWLPFLAAACLLGGCSAGPSAEELVRSAEAADSEVTSYQGTMEMSMELQFSYEDYSTSAASGVKVQTETSRIEKAQHLKSDYYSKDDSGSMQQQMDMYVTTGEDKGMTYISYDGMAWMKNESETTMFTDLIDSTILQELYQADQNPDIKKEDGDYRLTFRCSGDSVMEQMDSIKEILNELMASESLDYSGLEIEASVLIDAESHLPSEYAVTFIDSDGTLTIKNEENGTVTQAAVKNLALSLTVDTGTLNQFDQITVPAEVISAAEKSEEQKLYPEEDGTYHLYDNERTGYAVLETPQGMECLTESSAKDEIFFYQEDEQNMIQIAYVLYDKSEYEEDDFYSVLDEYAYSLMQNNYDTGNGLEQGQQSWNDYTLKYTAIHFKADTSGGSAGTLWLECGDYYLFITYESMDDGSLEHSTDAIIQKAMEAVKQLPGREN